MFHEDETEITWSFTESGSKLVVEAERHGKRATMRFRLDPHTATITMRHKELVQAIEWLASQTERDSEVD